jgi:RNA polymerase sigma-70 factor, ECF subfamily
VTIAGVGDDDRVGEEVTFEVTDFDTFFAQHHAGMVRALTLTLGDVEFGRDAASEGFARALQRWPAVSHYANPSGWVYRVGLNWARSRARKRRRERLGVTLEASVAPAGGRDHELVDALRTLSIDHRTVVVGRYYLDWSEAELAAALDVAPGTVKSRLSRALTELARIMEDHHGRS